MAMGAASILLMTMVSLEALLLLVAAAGTSAAAVSGGTIRLPSDAARAPAGVAAALVRAMARAKLGDEKSRPWKCCDVPICTKSWPPICLCTDTVERCASTCERCEQVGSGSGSGGPRYRCLDKHRGDPGPSCGGDRDWAPRLAARGVRF